MSLTFTVSRLSLWSVNMGELDNVHINSSPSGFEVTISSGDPKTLPYGFAFGGTKFVKTDNENVRLSMETVSPTERVIIDDFDEGECQEILLSKISQSSIMEKLAKTLNHIVKEAAALKIYRNMHSLKKHHVEVVMMDLRKLKIPKSNAEKNHWWNSWKKTEENGDDVADLDVVWMKR